MSSEEKELSLNKKILKDIRITSQEQMLLNCADQFYLNKKNSDKLIELINGEISIRLVDFFVTNYSKKNRVSYQIKEGDTMVNFNVHSSYKSQLKAWNKKHFDPFSRGDRIPFFLDQDCIITTIGQLNFFKWFISKNAYQYVEKNLSKIESEMNKSKKKCTSKPTSQVKPKKYRDNISQKSYNVNMINCSAPKKVTKIEVTFD